MMARRKYRDVTEREGETDLENGSIEEKWQNLKERVLEALIKKECKFGTRDPGYKEWWNRSCTRMKRKAHRMLRKWKCNKISKDKYIEARRVLKDFLEEKRKNKRLAENEELRKIRKEADAWKLINRREERQQG